MDAILTGFKKSLSKQGQLIVCENGFDDNLISYVTQKPRASSSTTPFASAATIDEPSSSDPQLFENVHESPEEALYLGNLGAAAAMNWMREQDEIEEYSLRCEAALEAA